LQNSSFIVPESLCFKGEALMFEFRSKSVLQKVNAATAALIFTCFVSVGQLPAQTAAPTTETLKNTTTSPEKLSASFAEVARIVEPAVVNIDTKGKVPEISAKGSAPAESADDILDFLRQMPRRPSSAVGSGFIVDKSGYILTNAHVVEDSSRITVRLDSGEEYVAKVVGTDEETDIAVLKIETGKDLPFVKLGNSENARVGDWVLALGSPFGLARTVTAGIVSQTKRETPQGSPFQKFIQTDAAINKGNSGGPLVNMNGEVIGINSQIATSTGDYNGIGFALPSNEAASVYRQILQDGKVRRGYLGVNLDSIKAEYAKVYNLKDPGGAIIIEVRDSQSAAAKAGLQVGDIVVEFNGQKVQSAQDLIGKVSATRPDESVNVVYLREAGAIVERKTTVIKLAERPTNNVSAAEETRRPLPLDKTREEVKPFGLTLTELTPALAANYKLEGQKGLLVKSINPASFIADVKSSTGGDALSEGDLIQRINRVAVTDTKSFNDVARLLKTGDAVVMHVLTMARGRVPQLKIVQFTVQ
jgi:serine protease Do